MLISQSIPVTNFLVNDEWYCYDFDKNYTAQAGEEFIEMMMIQHENKLPMVRKCVCLCMCF